MHEPFQLALVPATLTAVFGFVLSLVPVKEDYQNEHLPPLRDYYIATGLTFVTVLLANWFYLAVGMQPFSGIGWVLTLFVSSAAVAFLFNVADKGKNRVSWAVKVGTVSLAVFLVWLFVWGAWTFSHIERVSLS